MKDISSEIDWDNLDLSAVENPDEFSSQASSEQPSLDWSVNIGRAAAQIIKKKIMSVNCCKKGSGNCRPATAGDRNCVGLVRTGCKTFSW